MKKRGFIVASLGAVVLTGLALAASAQQPGDQPGPRPRMHQCPGPGGPGGFGPMFGPGPGLLGLNRLDLSDQQKDQIRTIQQSHRDEMRQIGERTRDAQRALEEATESANEADIRAKSNALAAVIGDGAVLRSKVNAEIRNLLTPEQQEKLKQFRTEMQQRMQQRGAEMQQRMKQRRSGAQ